MILGTDNNIAWSLINFCSQNKVYYSGETFWLLKNDSLPIPQTTDD